MPCSDLFIYFFLTLGAKFGNKIGVRLTIIVALLLKYISYAILLFIPNYYAVLAAMCLFGVGSGFGNLTYMKNSWKYFPKSQGLVNGIILGGAGISSSILTPLADFFIINPDKKPADEKTGLYDEEVANRVPTYITILCITFLVLGAISTIFTFPFSETDNGNENGNVEPKEKELEDETKGNTIKEKDNLVNEDAVNATLVETFFSTKNYMLFSFCFCGLCKS